MGVWGSKAKSIKLSNSIKYPNLYNVYYADLERGGWPVLQHLHNLQTLAVAYQKPGTKYYHKEELSKKIHLALNYWLDNDFQNPNWWNPEIGVPKYLSPVLIAMENELSPEQFQKGIRSKGY